MLFIDVYLLALRDVTPADEARLAAILDETELRRAGSFRFAHDRSAFIAAHGLARLVLGERASLPAATWRFRPLAHGKPVALAPDGQPWPFSLSHTRGLVAVAVADCAEIGIDVEAIVPATATNDLAAAFCTEAEMSGLMALERFPIKWNHLIEQNSLNIKDPDRIPVSMKQGYGLNKSVLREERFFALWTLKESLLKAAGFGLTTSPRAIDLRFDPLSIAGLDAPLTGNWHLWTMPFGDAHWLSVAAADQGSGMDLRYGDSRGLLARHAHCGA